MGLRHSLMDVPATTGTSVSVARTILNRFAFWANDAVRATSEVQMRLDEGDMLAATKVAEEADSATRDIYLALLALGATPPRDAIVSETIPPAFPGSSLENDISDSHRLLALLEEAYTLASRVDARSPYPPGELPERVCALLGWMRKTIGASPEPEQESEERE